MTRSSLDELISSITGEPGSTSADDDIGDPAAKAATDDDQSTQSEPLEPSPASESAPAGRRKYTKDDLPELTEWMNSYIRGWLDGKLGFEKVKIRPLGYYEGRRWTFPELNQNSI